MRRLRARRSGRAFDRVASFDAVVIGAGAAGLTAALELAPRRVALLTKGRPTAGGSARPGSSGRPGLDGSSALAQGGIAAAVGPGDSPALHAADTLAAGAGLNDRQAVELLTAQGPERVMRLVALGAAFDRAADGTLSLGREAAHGCRRVLHAHGDATGAEIVRALGAAVTRADHITLFEEAFAWDLVREPAGGEGERVAGVTALGPRGETVLLRAPAVILATGGLGHLFGRTTNPAEVTADGLAMAARAGARLLDVELVQFHPTALAVPGADPMPLLTEALRGEGAVLVDAAGRRFMLDEHPDAELAPRDVVARAIRRRRAAGSEVFLDARQTPYATDPKAFPRRFPTVFDLCRRHGLDPRREVIPVSPAAHYHMGGVAADASGRTSVPGLWACGEAAANGVHGANRLASNSLLEALVFGGRVAESVAGEGPVPVRLVRPVEPPPRDARRAPGSERGRRALAELRRLAWAEAGVERSGEGLERMLERLDAMSGWLDSWDLGGEGRNLLLAARLVATGALVRAESRGGHHRTDHPQPDPRWRRHLALELAGPEPGRSAVIATPLPLLDPDQERAAGAVEATAGAVEATA